MKKPSNKIYPEAEQERQAIRNWYYKELTEGLSHITSLGKYLFTVSISSIGTLIIKHQQLLTVAGFVSILLFVISMIVAVSIIIPRKHKMDGTADLFDIRNHYINHYMCLIHLWFLVWFIGLIFAVCSLF